MAINDAPKPPPPRPITGEEAARYVRTKHFTECSRQTVCNWFNKGVKGERLRGMLIGRKFRTTKEWVEEFLRRIGQ